MATLQAIYGIVQPQHPVLGRVMGALMKAAWQVINEDAGTANHTNRLALAEKVINDPESIKGKVWRLFLSSATVQAQIDNLDGGLTDAQIETVIITDQLNTLANMEAS